MNLLQSFILSWLFLIWLIYIRYIHNGVDLSKGVDVAKSNNSKECIVCNFWYFDHEFNFQNSIHNGCHGLTMLNLNLINIAIITVKDVDYCCVMHDISKSDAIRLLKKCLLDDIGYI